jgi:hypothetical protein
VQLVLPLPFAGTRPPPPDSVTQIP